MASYIIVRPEGILSSPQRAQFITRELYCITTPVAVQQPYQAEGNVFGVIAHPDGVQYALVVDLAYLIPVHPLATLERLVSLFPELTDTERLTLQAYIFANKEFRFGDIVPSTTTVRDEAYMQSLGWFGDDVNP
jgi:hypothetical protein